MILSKPTLASFTAVGATMVVKFLKLYPLLVSEIAYCSGILVSTVSSLARSYQFGMRFLILQRFANEECPVIAVIIFRKYVLYAKSEASIGIANILTDGAINEHDMEEVWCGGRDLHPHGASALSRGAPADPKSDASANFATTAPVWRPG